MAWAWKQTDENTGSTTLAVSLPTGTDRKIFFILAWEYSGKTTISSIDFGGSTPTLISDGTNSADVPDTNNNTAAGYYFDIPDAWSGSKTLTITFAATVTKNVNIAVTYTGLATGNADVVQTYQSAGSNITANTLNITPTASVGLIISGAGTSSNINWTPGSGETERGDGASGGNGGCGTEKGYTSNAANSTTQTSGIAGRYQQWNSAWSEAAAGTNRDVAVTVVNLSLTPNNTSGNRTVNVSVVNLTLTPQNAAINRTRKIDVTVSNLSLTKYNTTINRARGVNAGFSSLSITPLATTVTRVRNVNVGLVSLSLTKYNATIKRDRGVNASSVSLTMTANKATVTITAWRKQAPPGDGWSKDSSPVSGWVKKSAPSSGWSKL